MEVVIPSYKRWDGLKGADYFIDAKYVVPSSQVDKYSKVVGAKRVIEIPDEQDGNIAKKRNWILHNIPRPLVMIDDDVESIGYFEGRDGMSNGDHRRKTLDKDLVIPFFQHLADVANQFGCKMFGLAQNEDNRIYKEWMPFSLSCLTLGPVSGHLDHDLFYDENMGSKDDYDMGLQQLNKYRKIFRYNKAHYICGHGSNSGGIVGMRTKEYEIELCKKIMLKWGKKIISYKLPPTKMTDLLNAKSVNVPIKGV